MSEFEPPASRFRVHLVIHLITSDSVVKCSYVSHYHYMALCVDKEQFYEKLEELKRLKKGDSKFTIFIDDELYAKNGFKIKRKIMKNMV